jgi:integrase
MKKKQTVKELAVIENEIVSQETTDLEVSKEDFEKAINAIREKATRNTDIDKQIQIIEEEMKTNSELRNRILNMVAGKKVVEKIEKDYDMERMNIDNELEDFLNLQESGNTKKNYEKSVNDFILWCFNEEEYIDIYRISRKDVESYMVSLSNKYAPNSVRTKILSINSFYTFLIHRYPEIIKINPFKKLKLPKSRFTRRIDIITDNDLLKLKTELKRIGRNDIVCAVEILCKYGFRVGIFEDMKIDKEGNWQSVSKSQSMKGKFLKSEVQKIREHKLMEIKKTVITNVIVRTTEKLFKEGKIGSPFSPHDIRHYYITKNGKGLTIEEFLKFSKPIHKSPITTLNYINL